jgi:hypothetical protein
LASSMRLARPTRATVTPLVAAFLPLLRDVAVSLTP